MKAPSWLAWPAAKAEPGDPQALGPVRAPGLVQSAQPAQFKQDAAKAQDAAHEAAPPQATLAAPAPASQTPPQVPGSAEARAKRRGAMKQMDLCLVSLCRAVLKGCGPGAGAAAARAVSSAADEQGKVPASPEPAQGEAAAVQGTAPSLPPPAQASAAAEQGRAQSLPRAKQGAPRALVPAMVQEGLLEVEDTTAEDLRFRLTQVRTSCAADMALKVATMAIQNYVMLCTPGLKCREGTQPFSNAKKATC